MLKGLFDGLCLDTLNQLLQVSSGNHLSQEKFHSFSHIMFSSFPFCLSSYKLQSHLEVLSAAIMHMTHYMLVYSQIMTSAATQ